ncbi:hypothetical protein FRB94_005465 [Tulasnella sp. JGI-2019a]|nr:hypothetical protein FRB93_005661 [Tulasnella sp. JGI-2019a]KAG9000411.1 hypothetical protein FRB94_005465 [Tulasnella sp. JGI-2019a]KAG9031773.1 hypothetical protein FRB95_002313 [Tulasnella sp. JGI-2019a]
MSLDVLRYIHPKEWMRHLRDLSLVSPTLAGVLAPFCVLLDVPSVTENWYQLNHVPQTDPKASLILSGLGLLFSIIANGLLILRFSLTDRAWWIATCISVFCWLLKVVTSTANLITFGALVKNQDGRTYDEGFWCAVVSDVAAGIIFLLLLLHWFFNSSRKDTELKQNLRIAGRHFMLQSTMFLALVALSALIFSRIENWTYLQGMYFSIVSFLTIGFGDFAATKTSSRILLCPICIMGIALLGSLLEMIIGFFADRAADRKARTRAEFERRRQVEEDKHQRPADLAREIHFLHTMNEEQDKRDQISEFIFSCGGFLTFWIIGALIFSRLEAWSYGTGLYFCYVFFLTTGYGDVTPVTPAGRVVFIVYSLLAVPIMASFALQAITQVITRISKWRLNRQQAKHDVDNTKAHSERPPPSHAEYIERFSRKWEDTLQNQATAKDRDEQELLMHEVLKQAVELEAHARRLLISQLPNGSKAQVVLKADRNVQLRDVRQIRKRYEFDDSESAHMALDRNEGGREGDRMGGPDSVSRPMSDEEILDEVNMYRESFASMLAAGSRMRGLEGRERYLLERREEGKDQHEGREKDRDEAEIKEKQKNTL